MREIKFKVWNTETNNMWSHDLMQRNAVFALDAKLPEKNFLVIPNSEKHILLQYIGLKDKNGVEIYEGDILECKFHPTWYERISWEGEPDAICEVYYDYSGFGLKIKGKEDFRYSSCRLLLDSLEHESDLLVRMEHTESLVIGNIYEKPELKTEAA